MATCDYTKVYFRVTAGRAGGPAPRGTVASARFYRANGALPAPWNRGFLVGMLADNSTGPITVSLEPTGEAARSVVLDPGIVYLAVIVPTASGFRTVRSYRLDVRPVIGDQAAATAIINREWQALGAGDTQVLFWNIVDPSTRDQLASMAMARGIRTRMLAPNGEQELVPPARDCSWGSGGGGEAVPIDPGVLPTPPPLEQPAARGIGKTLFLVGSLGLLAVVGAWAWGK